MSGGDRVGDSGLLVRRQTAGVANIGRHLLLRLSSAHPQSGHDPRHIRYQALRRCSGFSNRPTRPCSIRGVTAQLECLLDDVVVGKQEMIGAIDAVCNVAVRIINKLKEGATAVGPSLLASAGDNGIATYPPTAAMKRFADS